MFSKIIVATDLSEASDKVVCTLGDLKHLGTREVFLVHCFNVRDIGGLSQQLKELATPPLEKQKKTLEDLGFKVNAKMIVGLPHLEINRLAEENECGMIVAGSHGHTMAGDMLLGGTASTLVHSVVKPLLLLPLKTKEQKEDERSCPEIVCDSLGHVLFPTDFSDNAEHAFSMVEKFAESGVRKITLFHVQDKARIGLHGEDRLEEFNQIDSERMARLEAELKKKGASEVAIEIPYGWPKQEILERLKKGDITLAIMGSQGRGYFGDLLLGSTSHAVARHTATPLLLVPMRS